ncbi:6-phosphogluconate dehydrogenase C-terminal domain-like protein [Zopfia rhizophila CBS 207.26]|uniref:6-phosphogluconate dehydrogenase, decarboxylating n=1 Tax=Zopfia rhizophila CBS 207.26 TaxID=1314779 RepID=A0A6A6DYH7_9PEZI|nr:6-phosphogluconate dehydrogenase C-terminal domain-like protein [Zopfia rhizophila CBS 207.26]
MLALLLAGNGVDVSIYDSSEASLGKAAENAEKSGLAARVHVCKDYDALCQSLGGPKVFIFSLPNGRPGDAVVQQLQPYLTRGDIVIDGSNENYQVTQSRQAMLRPRGVAYIGMGISGGFIGARHGPSLMPGGDKWALEQVLPLLTKIAAKDDYGRPCVTKIGSGGSGHFVKMVHNGIEHGIMAAICEAWELMDKCLHMDGEEIGSVFDSWCAEGELKGNFLVSISGPICRTKNQSNSGFLLHNIRDAVVQDANDSEGTGVWANLEAVAAHIPAPSLSAAHYLRIASADVLQRCSINASLGSVSPGQIALAPGERSELLEDLREAVYVAVLACFVQGLNLLERVNRREGWSIHVEQVIRIWRAGCIIKSDYIADLFDRSYARDAGLHLLCREDIVGEIKKCWPSLKTVVLKGLEADAHLPCLTATLEYLKYVGSTDLPTNFMEAQLDSFGAHGFDLKSEPVRHLSKGMSITRPLTIVKLISSFRKTPQRLVRYRRSFRSQAWKYKW